jgi:hypothetical protein
LAYAGLEEGVPFKTGYAPSFQVALLDQGKISLGYMAKRFKSHTSWVEVKSHSRAASLLAATNLKYHGHEKAARGRLMSRCCGA